MEEPSKSEVYQYPTYKMNKLVMEETSLDVQDEEDPLSVTAGSDAPGSYATGSNAAGSDAAVSDDEIGRAHV